MRSSATPEELLALLEDSGVGEQLTLVYGRSIVGFINARPLLGGASRQAWSFDAVLEGEDARTIGLVVRFGPEASLVESSLALEIEAERTIRDHIPVATILATHHDFIVMERLPGRADAISLTREPEPQRRMIVEEVFRTLGALSTVAVTPDPESALRVPQNSAAECEIDYWDRKVQSTRIERPVTAGVIRHLRAHLPPDAPYMGLVHGDYRVGNVMFDSGKITGVLDWEMAHYGDPLEDLGWALSRAWRAPDGSIGGALTDEEAVMAWEDGAGSRPDDQRLAWWRAFAYVKQNALWLSGAREFLDGRTDDLVYVSFGWKNFARDERWMMEELGWAK